MPMMIAVTFHPLVPSHVFFDFGAGLDCAGQGMSPGGSSARELLWRERQPSVIGLLAMCELSGVVCAMSGCASSEGWPTLVVAVLPFLSSCGHSSCAEPWSSLFDPVVSVSSSVP